MAILTWYSSTSDRIASISIDYIDLFEYRSGSGPRHYQHGSSSTKGQTSKKHTSLTERLNPSEIIGAVEMRLQPTEMVILEEHFEGQD